MCFLSIGLWIRAEVCGILNYCIRVFSRDMTGYGNFKTQIHSEIWKRCENYIHIRFQSKSCSSNSNPKSFRVTCMFRLVLKCREMCNNRTWCLSLHEGVSQNILLRGALITCPSKAVVIHLFDCFIKNISKSWNPYPIYIPIYPWVATHSLGSPDLCNPALIQDRLRSLKSRRLYKKSVESAPVVSYHVFDGQKRWGMKRKLGMAMRITGLPLGLLHSKTTDAWIELTIMGFWAHYLNHQVTSSLVPVSGMQAGHPLTT